MTPPGSGTILHPAVPLQGGGAGVEVVVVGPRGRGRIADLSRRAPGVFRGVEVGRSVGRASAGRCGAARLGRVEVGRQLLLPP
eukprot:2768061-Rhodomonas_salina.1